jgi:nucleoside transporter
MGNYLGAGLKFDPSDIGRAYTTTGYAAIVSPLFIGMIADRFFSAQHVMGILHLVGAGLMYWASTITTPGMFFLVLLAYTICYMPTIALVNSISFNQMTNSEKEFPGIRVMGTLGWIAAGLTISGLGKMGFEGIEATATPFKMAAIASLVMGVLSFSLPDTPPKGKGKKASVVDLLGLDAVTLMKDRSFAIFTISSLLICIPLAFYYSFANLFLNDSGMVDVAGKMTFGQMSEVGFMLLMPFFFKRLGIKKTILIGMLAWTVRYALFAYGNNDSLVFMFYAGILLHGICYDFFFVTGQIYADQKAGPQVRGQAQSLLVIVTQGLGMWIGAQAMTSVVTGNTQTVADKPVIDWGHVWLLPCLGALGILVLFVLLFRAPQRSAA